MRPSALLLALPALALAAHCASRPPGSSITVGAPTATTPAQTVDLDANDPSWGSPKAPVTIVVFSDFECPRCALAEIALDEVKDRFGEAQVRVVFKHAPAAFHPHARLAATVAQGVFELGGAAAFWSFHELAFTADDTPVEPVLQQTDGGEVDPLAGGVSLEWGTLVAWATRSGVREADLTRGVNENRWAAKIERDEALAKRLGVIDPPAIFVSTWRAPDNLEPCSLVRTVAGSLGIAVPPPSSGEDECQ